MRFIKPTGGNFPFVTIAIFAQQEAAGYINTDKGIVENIMNRYKRNF